MNRSKFPELAALLTGTVVHAAAMLTSDLIKAQKPPLYAHMQRHAPTHRLFPDALWTTGRILFMREGQSMPRHPDKENMPGTDGADLMLTFGEVGGAELTMHLPDDEQVVVRGAETILADFLNEHELGVMTGSGLRVAFVFWQQRTVVLSDYVQNSLGAFVFPGTLPKFPIVHYFWYDLSGDDSVSMRELNNLSMRSAVKHQSTVWLWSYQTFTNLPPGVKQMDANELLPIAEFKRLMTVGKTKYIEQGRADEPGRNIAHLSDLIRALALQKYGGWWLDCDTIVQRRLPTAKPYYFATVAQKRMGGGYLDPTDKVESNRVKWAGKNADFLEWDGSDSFQNTPIFISRPNTPLANVWVERLRAQLLNERTLQWSDTIKTMEACIVELSLNQYVCPPGSFCPWPFWQRDHPIQPGKLLAECNVYGVRVPPLEEVMTSSYTVQFFFMSIEKTETSKRDDDWFHLNVMQTDCAARRVLQAGATSVVATATDIQGVAIEVVTEAGEAGTSMPAPALTAAGAPTQVPLAPLNVDLGGATAMEGDGGAQTPVFQPQFIDAAATTPAATDEMEIEPESTSLHAHESEDDLLNTVAAEAGGDVVDGETVRSQSCTTRQERADRRSATAAAGQGHMEVDDADTAMLPTAMPVDGDEGSVEDDKERIASAICRDPTAGQDRVAACQLLSLSGLNIISSSPLSDIDKAHAILIKVVHPDRFSSNKELANKAAGLLNAAKDCMLQSPSPAGGSSSSSSAPAPAPTPVQAPAAAPAPAPTPGDYSIENTIYPNHTSLTYLCFSTLVSQHQPHLGRPHQPRQPRLRIPPTHNPTIHCSNVTIYRRGKLKRS